MVWTHLLDPTHREDHLRLVEVAALVQQDSALSTEAEAAVKWAEREQQRQEVGPGKGD